MGLVRIEGDKPMMSDQEIEIIDSILRYNKPKYCLEWGSGNSTLVFPQHKFIKHWLSIEHNGHYANHLVDKLPSNTSIVWIPDTETYYRGLRYNKNRFDFIFIDGDFRKECLEVALDIAHKDTVILLHDAGRKEYQDFLRPYRYEMLSQGEIPQSDGGYAHRGIARIYQG